MTRHSESKQLLGAQVLSRTIVEHTSAMILLSDRGLPAARALWMQYEVHRERVLESVAKDELVVPAVKPPDPAAHAGEGVEEARKLLNDVESRLASYPDGDLYSVYRLTSSYVHPSVVSSMAYVDTSGAGIRLISQQSGAAHQNGTEPACTASAIMCALATSVMARHVPELNRYVEGAAPVLGVWPRMPTYEKPKDNPGAGGNPRAAAERLLALIAGSRLTETLQTVSDGAHIPTLKMLKDMDALVTRLQRLPDYLDESNPEAIATRDAISGG